jgi:hypothetical protein
VAVFAGVARADAMRVIVLKRAGVTAYEEVAEEFAERCRVRARVISFSDEGVRQVPLSADDLVVTVGQDALDGDAGTHAHVIPTLAFVAPEGLVGPPTTPHPELILRVLTASARPKKIHTIGVVYGPRSASIINHATRAAERLGLTLYAVRATSGPQAVRALHALAGKVEALWLPADTDVITSQVFQYALTLQLELGLPVAAATRQQVHAGALCAADYSPRAAGRIAADIANRYLAGIPTDPSAIDVNSGAQVTVNGAVARRLGADLDALMRLGARVE